jgi:hypothetical protein
LADARRQSCYNGRNLWRYVERNAGPHSDEEAQRRFLAAVKALLNTKPKSLKSMSRKGVLAQSNSRDQKRRSSSVK